MELKRLGKQEMTARGLATHLLIVTYADLTETTADTDQVLEGKNALAGDLVECVGMKLVTPFSDASDAAFNSTLVSLGDAGDTDRFLAATQVNKNGTEINFKAGTGTKYAYLVDDTIDVTVESMSAKSLSNLDAGEVHFLLNVIEL